MYKIADAHCDFLSHNTIEETDAWKYDQMSFSDLIRGGVALQTFALWVPADHEDKYAASRTQIDYLNEFIAQHKDVMALIKRSSDYFAEADIKALLSIEGGECIDSRTELIDEVYNYGVRIMSLTWNDENGFAHGSLSEGGIKERGYQAIKKLNQLKIALDVSHLNEQGFWEAVGVYAHPICATHSCVYELCKNPRNLKKDQIRHIINTDGFIGINFFPQFLTGREARIKDILRHIEYILELGGENNLGFGSDFCGIENTPRELRRVSDFQNLPCAMEYMGYKSSLIKKICYGNFKRFILKFL